MDELLDLFTAARAARDEALARVEENADARWLEAARRAVERICRERATWIVDDVWATGLARPREARALGAVVRQAARDGLCEPTDEYRPSAAPRSHCNPRVVWRSLIYCPALARRIG